MNFSKHDTQVAKGVAIIMMVFHHLFFDSGVSSTFGVEFPILGSVRGYTLAQLSKICVFVFVFLSAYGITKSWMRLKEESSDSALIDKQMRGYSMKRCINILAGYMFIFVIVYALAWAFPNTPHSLPYPPNLYGTRVSGICYTLLDFFGLAFLWRGPTLNAEWWYMSIALLLVFAMPSFLRWYQKAGFTSYIVMALLANWIYFLDREGIGHLTALPLGIAFAVNDWFVKARGLCAIKKNGKGFDIINKIIRMAAAAAVFLFFMQFAASNISFYVGYQLATPAMIYLCYEVLSGIPLLGKCLAFVGRHAMNIYFTHTLILRSFIELVYAPKYAGLVLLWLMGLSLLVSVLLELLKRLLRYDKLIAMLSGKAMKTAA